MWSVFLVLGCNSDSKIDSDGLNSEEVQEIVYSLTLTEPQYGVFYGDDSIPVVGRVEPADAKVIIEGEEITPQSDGTFSYDLPIERVRAYHIVDVTVQDADIEERIPVFTGLDPKDTWPGGMSARLLPNGLDVLGAAIGSQIDASGWASQISAQLPDVDWTWIGFRPNGVVHDPTLLKLKGVDDGLAVDIALMGVGIDYELWYLDQSGAEQTGPMYIIFDEIGIGATAVPEITEEGVLTFSFVDADLTMDAPDFQFGALEGWIMEWVVDNLWTWVLEPVTENILETVLSEIGTIEIGGPFAFETELMGNPFSLALDDVRGDPDGLALGVDLQFGALENTQADDVVIPSQEEAPNAQLAVGLHEGLLQEFLAGELLSLLSQDLDLGGPFGAILGNGIMTLPGGDDAPDGDGWCLSINPGSATSVRLQQGIEPLAYLFIPDLMVNIGIKDGNDCEDWLVASLATEVGLRVEEGSKLTFDFTMPEGKILYYGADDYDEQEVLYAFSNYLQTMIGLLGGVAEIDLADILAGGGTGNDALGLGEVNIEIVDSQPLWGENLSQRGLYAISLNIWPNP